MEQLFTCQSCQSRQATTTRGFGRAAFSRCRAVCSPLERPAISGPRSSAQRRTIGWCSPARIARYRGRHVGGRFGGAMWPERSASRSRRSGRRLRLSGGGSSYAGGSGFRLFNATETKKPPVRRLLPTEGGETSLQSSRMLTEREVRESIHSTEIEIKLSEAADEAARAECRS